MQRTASGEGRRRCQGQRYPKGRLAAGSGFVIGLERCAASLSVLFLS
ncbi:MAG: hypothetical protein AAF543_12955 [Pseudomonadota bacterium]